MANSVEEPISFVDPEVESICVAKWGKNGVVTKSDLKKVTSLGSTFFGKTAITRFPELAYFENLTYIDASAFSGCSNLQEVIMPDSVTSIQSYAFANCTSLTNVHISTNLTAAIDKTTFLSVPTTNINHLLYIDTLLVGVEEGIDLSSYTLESKTLYIGDYAFAYKSLSSISINANNKIVGSYAFNKCNNLSSVAIHANTVMPYAFSECESLGSITIDENVNRLYASCFYQSPITTIQINVNNSTYADFGSNAIYNKSGTELIIGCSGTVIRTTGTTTIKQYAFSYVTKTKLTIPSNITTLETSSFRNCNITEIDLPDGIRTIPMQCFAQSTNLTTVNISSTSNLTTVRSAAFNGTGLTSIYIPSKCITLDSNPFSYCTELESITVAANNTKYSGTIATNAVVDKSTKRIVVGCKNTVVTSEVRGADYNSFMGVASGIMDFTNYTSFHYMGSSSFENSVDLTSIKFDLSTTTDFGSRCLAGCTGLTELDINPSSIGQSAFYGCSNLTSITIRSTNPFMLEGAGAFSNTNNCPIYVPASAVNSYKQNGKWVSLASRIFAIPS